VFKDKLGVAVLTVMLPAPVDVKLVDVVPLMEPVVVVIVPEPLAERVTVPPLIVLAPIAMKPLLPLVDKDSAPDALRLDATVKLLLSNTVKLVKVDPDDSVAAPMFEMTALPVVLTVNADVDVRIGFAFVPMVPEPELRLTEVEPETTPVLSCS